MKYTNQFLLNKVLKLSKNRKRIPTRYDNRNLVQNCIRRFGSWKKTLQMLDLFPTEEKLRELYINQFLSCKQIGEKYHLTKTAIQFMLSRYKILKRTTTDYKGRLPSGPNHHGWKGGKFKSYGYWIIRKNGKHIPEHRVVMEKHLKRLLKSSEIVHHLNGIRDDNRVENLAVMPRDQHGAYNWTYVKSLQKRIRELEHKFSYFK